MRSLQDWLDEYSVSHQDPTNKMIHGVCVPLIMLSALSMMWSIARPPFFAGISPYLNWATLLIALSLVYYFLLSVRLAAGMLLVSLGMCLVLTWLMLLPWPLFWTSLAIFTAAWVGQFIGHK